MAGNNDMDRGTHPIPHDGTFARYSRFGGIDSYRRKRRQGRVFRFFMRLFLISVIAAVGFLVGRQYLGELPLPFAGTEPEPQAVEEVPEEPIATQQPAKITLVAAGDVIMNSAVVESGLKPSGAYGFDHLFQNLAEELDKFDLRIVDQETGLAGSKFGFGHARPLNAPQELGRAEANAGFNVILRATDHTLDNGHEGLHNELMWWKSEFPTMPLLGVAEPDPQGSFGYNDYVGNVYLYEKDGFKVAVLNHSWGIGEEDSSVVSALTEEKVEFDVRKAREAGAELIVACPHWGMEGVVELSEEETTFSQLYADLGVDLVIGGNPRVLQRAEVIEGKDGHKTVCFYSLGCLVSSLYSQNLVGGLAEVTLARDDSGACSVTEAVLKPIVTHRAASTDYGVYLASDYTDELALSSWDASQTPEEISRHCKEVFGDAYDAEAMEVRIAV